MTQPVRVLITGATSHPGYFLSFKIAEGCLWPDRKIILHLFDIPEHLKTLEALSMELKDCAFPNLEDIVWSYSLDQAFAEVEYIFLIGLIKKQPGWEKEQFLKANGSIFKEYGEAINQYAHPSARVLVMGPHSNTNALVALHYMKRNRPENIISMCMLNHNRITGEIATKCGISAEKIKKVIAWGNQTTTVVADVSNAEIIGRHSSHKVSDSVPLSYRHGELMDRIAYRTNSIINMSPFLCTGSCAKSALDQMNKWIHGTPKGDLVTMGMYVAKENAFGIQPGVFFGLPCTVKGGTVYVCNNVVIDDYVKQKIRESEQELHIERHTVLEFLKD